MQGNFSFCNPTRLHFGKESLAKLADELLGYGPNLEVLEPEHLREDFKQESACLGRMYWD